MQHQASDAELVPKGHQLHGHLHEDSELHREGHQCQLLKEWLPEPWTTGSSICRSLLLMCSDATISQSGNSTFSAMSSYPFVQCFEFTVMPRHLTNASVIGKGAVQSWRLLLS